MSIYESKSLMALKQKLLKTIRFDFENKEGMYNPDIKRMLVKEIDSINLGGYYLDLVIQIGSPKIVLSLLELYFTSTMTTMYFDSKTKVLSRMSPAEEEMRRMQQIRDANLVKIAVVSDMLGVDTNGK